MDFERLSMKNNAAFCILLCFILIFGSISPIFAMSSGDDASAFSSTDLTVTNGNCTADGQMPLLGSGKLLDASGAAFLFEVNSGTVMYAWNPDVQLEPASLVKIMTGLLAAEHGDLSAVVTVRKEALNALPETASTTKLKAGETITLSDLLYCLLVGSSNDAAVVIADHISGSQDTFVSQMNAKGEELGLHGTVFTNPHGLHDPSQVTTARDMAKLLAYASTVEAFVPFFAATQYTVPATNLSETRELSSTNYMMMTDKPSYYDSRVTGGRTGITSNRDRCLAVTAESGSLSFVGVILSAVPVFQEDGFTVKRFGTYEEMGELLDMAFDGYRIVQVLNRDQVLMQCSVVGGDNVVAAMPKESVRAVLPSGITMDGLSVQYEQNIHELTAPIQAGQVLTKVQLWYNNICIAQSEVVAANASHNAKAVVVPHTVDHGMSAWKVLLIIAAALVLLAAIFVGVLFVIRFYRKAAFHAQQRRRRRERRRSR